MIDTELLETYRFYKSERAEALANGERYRASFAREALEIIEGIFADAAERSFGQRAV
jgi:hypothetical protein